jgi:type IV secretory pathway VirD2 relaxase
VATCRPTAQTRRVVIKARFVKLGRNGATAAALHLRYIQREGVERDGRAGVLYGPKGEVAAATFEQPRFHEERQFRLIVSPEDAGDLDLTVYVRRLMAQVERDVRQPLEWAAVNHYNTDHPHAHVVVRGVDRRGEQVRFDRQYIGRGMRERAQEIATQELGPRSLDDVQRARAREIAQERLTSLDRALAHHERDGRVDVTELEPSRRRGVPLLARLEHLERMQLAERLTPGIWALAPGWQEQLRGLGERNDIVRQMHAAVRGDPARYRVLDPDQPLPSSVIHGCVRAKGLADELRGPVYAIVEAPDGHAYRVLLDARTADACRVGDFVALSRVHRPRGRAEDSEIEAMAQAAGGRCSVSPDGPPARAPDLARRLRELEGLGLAHRETEGTWLVALPLREALERLDRERPVHRLVVRTDARDFGEQVRTRGPVWLDHLDPSTFAPWGLGGELGAVVARRAEQLRDWGIDPNDRECLPKLREAERRAVGERVAAGAGLAFLADTPARFRGRLLEAPGAPGYAVVSDGTRAVVLPMASDLRPHVGHVVAVDHDGSGRLRIRADLDRGR